MRLELNLESEQESEIETASLMSVLEPEPLKLCSVDWWGEKVLADGHQHSRGH